MSLLIDPKSLSPSWGRRSAPQPRFVDKVDHSDDPDYEVFLQEYEEEQAREQLDRTAPSMRYVDLSTIRTKPSKLPAGKRIVGHTVVANVVSDPMKKLHPEGKVHRLKFAPGCFKRVLECDLPVFACVKHNRRYAIARTSDSTLRLWEEPNGLHCEMVPYDTRRGTLATACVGAGVYSGMSIGWDSLATATHWSDYKGMPLATIVDCELHEITVTDKPHFPQTSCSLHHK